MGGWFSSGFVFESWAFQGLPTWSPPFRIKSRLSAAVLLIDDTWSCNHPFSLNYTHCLGNPILGRDYEHTTHGANISKTERWFLGPSVVFQLLVNGTSFSLPPFGWFWMMPLASSCLWGSCIQGEEQEDDFKWVHSMLFCDIFCRLGCDQWFSNLEARN
jgi:hypothetical protein